MKTKWILILLMIVIVIQLYLQIHKEGLDNMYEYTAIIIEPRKHKALEFVLNNFANNLSKEWNIIVFHGTENKEYVENIINKLNRNIQMEDLNVKNLTITEYNKLLTTKSFYDKIPTEIFLIFQTDTIINKDHQNIIDEFIEYDYVGAPWRDGNVGNGGLSLRRKSKMLEILDKCKYNNENEDIYFSMSCPNVKKNVPNSDKAKEFSVETVYHDKSFGFHKPWLHINNQQYEILESKYNDLKLLRQLNE